MPETPTYTAFLMKAGQEASGRITGPHPLVSGEPSPVIRQSYTTTAGEHRVATYELSETIGAPQLYEYTLVSDEQVDGDTVPDRQSSRLTEFPTDRVSDRQSNAWASTLPGSVRRGSMTV